LLRHRIDHAVANSQAGAQVMMQLGLEPRRVSVIANGLPVDRVAVLCNRATVRRKLDIDLAVPVICAVTRPDKTKDLSTLYAAFDVVRTQRPDAELVLVGATAEELREFGAALPVGARAIGFQKRPVDYMNAADVIAISSRTEGHSNVADEGLMLGMPVVATDTGGHPPLVRMSGGRVVPVGRGDLLGAGLVEMLRAPPSPEDVRAVAERHLSMVGVADAMATLYAGLLSDQSARRLS
jgi:glycosyltransferase involved in cell wall biosynthesis